MTFPDQNENEVQGQPQEFIPDSGTDVSSSQQETSDLYAPYLEKFPESLHSIARDVFKEWDGNVTKRIQSVHSEYEPYKPIVEQYEADAVQQAIALAEAMERDPQAFYAAMAEAYGLVPQQQGQEFVQQEEITDEYDNDPNALRLQQHEALLQTMAETMLAERQEREQAILHAEQDSIYEQTMVELEQKYGEFDVNYVDNLLAQGVDPDTAVQHWQSQVEAYAQKRLAPNNNAPIVMGAGGGTPSIQRPVEELSSQDTRKLVEEMLRRAAEQS